jgi:putative hydrolase of the HAD superfamily
MSDNLSRTDAWVFDLDNTLYPASSRLFGQIDRRMKAFITAELRLSPENAFALQKRYYHRYGTTLRGLMVNHDIDPDAFLDYVHDIDHAVLTPDPNLKAVLDHLPGRKFIYTNGTTYHATQVMTRLGITDIFEDIFDIRAGGYVPKPEPAPYRVMIERHNIEPTRAVMVEDSFKNLQPAANMGMTTVWVRHAEHVPAPDDDLSYCDYVTDDMIGWLRTFPNVAYD